MRRLFDYEATTVSHVMGSKPQEKRPTPNKTLTPGAIDVLVDASALEASQQRQSSQNCAAPRLARVSLESLDDTSASPLSPDRALCSSPTSSVESPTYPSRSYRKRASRLSPEPATPVSSRRTGLRLSPSALEEEHVTRIGTEYQVDRLPRVGEEDPIPTEGIVLWDPRRAQEAKDQGQDIGELCHNGRSGDCFVGIVMMKD
jgi:hypothetical protein